MSEAVIHRVLGAVRFLDAATRRPVRQPLRITAEKRMVWRRNQSGEYVVWGAEGLEAHTGDTAVTDAEIEAVFQAPPGAPAAGSLRFVATVEDPSGELLDRQFEIALPRASTAAPGVIPDLFTPVEVLLYRQAGARAVDAVAVLYAFVHDGRGQAGKLPGALVTVSVDGNVVGSGVTGPTGEALIEATRVPSFVTGNGGGAVTTPEVAATVRARVLPSLITRGSSAEPWRLARAPDPESPDFQGGAAKVGDADATLVVGRPANVSVAVSL